MKACKKIDWIESEYIDTFEYWNDRQVEKAKVFDVTDGNYEKLEDNEHLTQIFRQLQDLIQAESVTLESSAILSLACGTCWLEGRAFNKENISLIAVDFSRHRIHEIAPKTLEWYGMCSNNVTLVHGSILDLKIAAETQDVVLLSQAFHHTNEPIALLREIRRVLRADGVVIIVGEHFYSKAVRAKRSLKHLIKYVFNFDGTYRRLHSLFPDYQTLFPRCFQKGDMHYPMVEYDAMFSGMGFKYVRYMNKEKTLQGFILRKNNRVAKAKAPCHTS